MTFIQCLPTDFLVYFAQLQAGLFRVDFFSEQTSPPNLAIHVNPHIERYLMKMLFLPDQALPQISDCDSTCNLKR